MYLHAECGKRKIVCLFFALYSMENPVWFAISWKIYRYLIDDFLIEYCRTLSPTDFIVKVENLGRKKMGKRIHLCEYEADSLADGLNGLFSREVEIPRIKYGRRQMLDTLISEEALLLAKFLRNEKKEWNPRVVLPD